ncbi:hypothetical protein HYT51_01170 [Candidatus Woesearchaeota archaeon]|nr:hypothetical protein [Candidatus Woesearchaeota archaeon]
MDKSKEILINILKKLKIKGDQDYKGVIFTDNEFADARNNSEPRKGLINLFLWDEEAIKFIVYFAEKLKPEEICIGEKLRGQKHKSDYFVNADFTKSISQFNSRILKQELERLYPNNLDYVFGVRFKIRGQYYSITTTGHEYELEFQKELIRLLDRSY